MNRGVLELKQAACLAIFHWKQTVQMLTTQR
jgi:hypothetical protein